MLDKSYNAEKLESKWQKHWEDQGIYKFDPDIPNSKRPIYSIDTPPPTVSGKMHMGHAFANSQQDFIARYKRMRGFNVLQPLGTDDNGLPTQTLVQELKKVKARDMGRKAFRKLCMDTLESGLKQSYINDWKRLGISCDYGVGYSTIDKHAQGISQWSFIELYKMGRAYRTEAAAMWCPKCETAISQVELVDEKKNAFFNDVVFKVAGEELVIATTRPELLPACVAVFYHPNDKRYKHLKGKKATVPLFDFEVPILEDERADPEKGTGIVMCCTFGDQTDMEWQKEHQLPVKEAITKDGKMTKLAKGFEGLSIPDAQKKIVMTLHSNGLLKKQEQITHEVNCHERCGTPIEFIQSMQWFIKYLDLQKDMLKWGAELKWFPAHMKNRYDNWVKGLKWDWCISRQIYFGVPFPVWFCEECDEVILAREEDLPVDPVEDKPPVDACPKCKSKKILGEKDIINTWATSSLTPTIVKELFKGKPVYDFLVKNPMDLRPQGHDIISFWLFNTVLKSRLHFKIKPWNDCFINGWMLDPKGKKMSKSKGNIIEPQDMIKKYSADALRYMAGSSKLGEDLNFPEKELVSGKKTIIKLWNASRFCYSHLEGYNKKEGDKLNFKDMHLVDRWLLIQFNKLAKASTEQYDKYNFSEPKKAVDNFLWHVFCDYYLEIVKHRLYTAGTASKDDEKAKLSAQYTLYNVLLGILKLFAPVMPHITEEIYQVYYAGKDKDGCKSIHISGWPEHDAKLKDEGAEQAGDLAVKIIGEVRKHKTSKKVSLKEEVDSVGVEAPFDLKKLKDNEAKGLEQDIINTIKAKELEIKSGKEFKINIK